MFFVFLPERGYYGERHRDPFYQLDSTRESQRERTIESQREPWRATEILSGSLWFSLALSDSLGRPLALSLQICLQSPCLAHKALARLRASFLRSSTLSWYSCFPGIRMYIKQNVLNVFLHLVIFVIMYHQNYHHNYHLNRHYHQRYSERSMLAQSICSMKKSC